MPGPPPTKRHETFFIGVPALLLHRATQQLLPRAP
jgi:hypothetical protein